MPAVTAAIGVVLTILQQSCLPATAKLSHGTHTAFTSKRIQRHFALSNRFLILSWRPKQERYFKRCETRFL